MAKLTTTAGDLRGKTEKELSDLAISTKNALFAARFENYTNKLNDTSRLSKLRREIARINSVLTEKRRASSTAKTNATATAATTTTKSEG